MVKARINQFSPKDIPSLVGILILSIGGIFENLLGLAYLTWPLIIIGCFLLFYNEKKVFWKSTYLVPILILLVVSIISYLVTPSKFETMKQLSRFWTSIVVCVIYFNWVQRKRENQLIIVLGLVSIGIGMAVISPFVVEWSATKVSFLPDFLYDWLPPPVVNDTVHPNTIASIMILLFSIPLALAILLFRQLNYQSILLISFCLGVTGLMIIPLVLSKSRAGLLAGGLSIVVLLWFCNHQKLARLLGLVFGGISLLVLYGVFQTGGQTSNEVLDSGSLLFRLRVWEITISMLQDFPFTGVGIGTFNITATNLYPPFIGMLAHPGAHNLYFQIGADLGLIGLIAMMAIYMLALYMGRESIRFFAARQDIIPWAMSAGLTTGLIAILLHGITDINVWGTRGAFAPWMVMGLIGGIYVSTRLAKE